LARRAADGSYTIVGRAKDMLISGGENIYPAELENLLAEHPGVADCAVIGLPHPLWGEEVVACLVAVDAACDTSALQTELAALLAQKIARYKLPRRWVWRAALPKTALGKVQKDLLKQSF
jgi:fatty-acyl-CoA synthase